MNPKTDKGGVERPGWGQTAHKGEGCGEKDSLEEGPGGALGEKHRKEQQGRMPTVQYSSGQRAQGR